MKNLFKNPYLNSMYAEAYIVIVALIIRSISRPNTPDTFFDPVVALSLFVLSAAIMGYIFLGEPAQLFLSGEKGKAISFFMKTVLGFAVITIIAVAGLKFLHQ